MRKRMANRRLAVHFKFDHVTVAGSRYFIGSVGFFEDGTIGELFINTEMKAGSEADINAADAAVAISLALQYGCPLEVLREAMKRNVDGSPMGPISHALDLAQKIVKPE